METEYGCSKNEITVNLYTDRIHITFGKLLTVIGLWRVVKSDVQSTRLFQVSNYL